MQDLTITLVQSDLIWEQPEKNLACFNEKFKNMQGMQDVIVLPEMFSTGFTMNVIPFSEDMNGITVSWMKEKARELNSVITGSFIYRKGNRNYNRLVWMFPDGNFQIYDKRHLFRFGGENEHFSPGEKKKIIEYKGWRICPLVCYDLRFPVWAKNKYYDGNFEYDLLIYIANWPEARKLHWQTLLKARAIENLSYVVGVNRIGTDGRNTKYSGNSMAVSSRGEILNEIEDNRDKIETVKLSKPALLQYRAKFNVAQDWDEFKL